MTSTTLLLDNPPSISAVELHEILLTTDTQTPFVWREKEGFVKLPTPPGFDIVRGVAFNNRGTELLEARRSGKSLEPFGYLIVNGVLKELPSAPGAKSTWYLGLNDKGCLVGVAQKSEGSPSRGFVALPVR